MKTLGIIGGLGPESTIEYYGNIIELYRARRRDGSYPQFIINSVDLKKGIDFIAANDLTGMANYLLEEIGKLARAGADFGLISANTPHIVFDDVAPKSPIPLISIVEATCEKARALQMKRLGLFGTRFTMQGRFYPDVFSRAGLTIVIPNQEEVAFINEKYFGEFLKNIFLPATRESLLAIVDRMKERDGIEGLILGGTELPLLLRDSESDRLPFLDTTRIHVERIIQELLS